MEKTQFEPSISTRPVYGVLEAQPGARHLFVADAEGAEAILDMAKTTDAGFFGDAHIIYITKHCGDRYDQALQALNPAQLYIGPSYQTAEGRLKHVLAQGTMGLVIYTAGTEGVMGQTIAEAMKAGYSYTQVQTEHRGSTARRMQCVHCKGITEDVLVDPFQCSQCGLYLFVRDHYSRRLAAFQGVRVDAEDPGNIPPIVERFV